MAEVFTLPQHFSGDSQPSLWMEQYVAPSASTKNRVVFTHHLLCFLIAGHKQVQSLEGSLSFAPDHLLLFGAGSTLMSERLPDEAPYQSLLLFFDPASLSTFCLEHRLTASPAPRKRSLLVPTDAYVRTFQQSLLLIRETTPYPPELLKAKLHEILLYLHFKYPQGLGAFLSWALQQEQALPFRQTIAAHLDEPISVEELAFLCNMSLSTFKRKFTKIYQTSPHKYFTRYRIAKAKTLLQSQHKPSDIFYQVGYESLSAFSHEFKKHVGSTPTQFAEEHLA